MSGCWVAPLGKKIGDKEHRLSEIFGGSGSQAENLMEKIGFVSVFWESGKETLGEFAVASVPNEIRSWLQEKCDFLIVVTSSNLSISPGLASEVHFLLSLSSECSLLSVNEACTGFVSGLDLAFALVNNGSAQNVLLLVVDKYSTHIAPGDKRVGPLFSDGSSSFLISSSKPHGEIAASPKKWTRLYRSTYASGAAREILQITRGTYDTPSQVGQLEMDGGRVYSFVLAHLGDVFDKFTDETGANLQEVPHWFVHQGSRLVVAAVAKFLHADEDLLFRAREYGNTVGSSIPFQLMSCWEDLQEGDLVGLLAFGIGMSIGAYAYEISGPEDSL
jgi:3-oxoacyl-[acyl-carrier-protein] synthase-3